MTSSNIPASGGTPALDPEIDTAAIPRPANELDGEGTDEESEDLGDHPGDFAKDGH